MSILRQLTDGDLIEGQVVFASAFDSEVSKNSKISKILREVLSRYSALDITYKVRTLMCLKKY